jgi:chromosome segregation ATPase|tara:strand:+ start:287 stop:730 length:444 start_codon:yes stop_codon:yes gene_type:complete
MKTKMGELETEVKLLKKELEDQRSVHNRLDIAIEKLTDLSNSIHRMLAVHEEKLDRQDEAITDAGGQLEKRRTEILTKIEDLHSRITTNTKEIMAAAATQHAEQNKEIQKIRDELKDRVGILEKWRHVLIGASIVAGFILNKMLEVS